MAKSRAKEFLKTDIVLSGVQELSRFLRDLPKKTIKKALKSAVNAGAEPIKKAARRLAPKRTGTLKKSITKKVKVYPSGNAVAIIGANRNTVSQGVDLGKGGNLKIKQKGRIVPANYIHLVAYGTAPHAQPLHWLFAKQGHPGAKANNFMKAAYDQNKHLTAVIMENKMHEVLTQEAKKLATTGAKAA